MVALADWLEGDGQRLTTELDRLFVPRNDPRWLRRNALVALGNRGRSEDARLVEAFVGDPDPVLRGVAERAERMLEERSR